MSEKWGEIVFINTEEIEPYLRESIFREIQVRKKEKRKKLMGSALFLITITALFMS